MYSIYNLLKKEVTYSCVRRISEHGLDLVDFFVLSNKVFSLTEREKSVYIMLREHAKKLTFDETLVDSVHFLAKFGVSLNVIDILYKNDIKTIKQLKSLNIDDFNRLKISAKSFEKIMLGKDALMEDEEKHAVLTLVWLHQTDNHDYSNYLQFMKNYFSQATIDNMLVKQIQLQRFEIVDEKIQLYEMSIERLKKYESEDVHLFLEKVDGKTLQEIGEQLDLTKERIRQRLNKILLLIGDLKYDKYRKVFTCYEMQAKDFEILFNEPSEVYYYLNTKYSKGILPVYTIFEKYKFTKKQRQALLSSYHLMYNHRNEVVHLNYSNIFTKCVYTHRNQTFDLKTVEKPFYDALKKYLVEEEHGGVSIRGIVDRCENIIFSDARKFRYFDFYVDEYVLDMINKITHLPEGLYGCQKIYDENLKVMKKLGLRDGIEFCDFCTRFVGIENLQFINKIHRRSEIQIGALSKKQFIQRHLLYNASRKLNDVVDEIVQQYGLNKNSLLTYIGAEFSDLLTNQHITIIKDIDFANEIEKYINQYMYLPLYPEDQFLALLNEYFPSKQIQLSRHLLKNTNYTIDSGIVYLKTYKTVSDAIIDYILKQEKFSLNSFKFPKNTTLYSIFRKLELQLKIFKVKEDTFVSAKHVLKKGLNKSLIRDFIKKSSNVAKNHKVFTFYSLVNEGFSHPLFDYEFDPYFYERLLTLIEDIHWIKTKPYLFTFKEAHLNLNYIFKTIFENDPKISHQTLQLHLKNKYNFQLSKHKIELILKQLNVELNNE